MKYIFEKLNARLIALAALVLFSIATIAVMPAHAQEIYRVQNPELRVLHQMGRSPGGKRL